MSFQSGQVRCINSSTQQQQTLQLVTVCQYWMKDFTFFFFDFPRNWKVTGHTILTDLAPFHTVSLWNSFHFMDLNTNEWLKTFTLKWILLWAQYYRGNDCGKIYVYLLRCKNSLYLNTRRVQFSVVESDLIRVILFAEDPFTSALYA